MNRLQPIYLFILLLSISLFSCKKAGKGSDETIEQQDTIVHNYLYGICIDSLNVAEYAIRSGDNPALIFNRMGFSSAKADSISRAAAGALDPRKLRAGRSYYTFTPANDTMAPISHIVFSKSLTDFAVIDLTGEDICASEFRKEITRKRFYTDGVLNSSLWNVLKANGTDPLLAIKIADLFAWQIDFYDVKEGDSFQVLYDVAYIDDTTALYIDRIETARFTHQGKDFYAIPFLQDSLSEYFDEEGNSLRKAFLKAPLDIFRITSHFSNSRLHPILKRYRAHHGVDYAAPTGTPVKTIGDGTVIAKAYEGGGGNYVKIRHNSVYTTTYMHLSKFAQGMRVGKQVRQGEVIGYVGSTGLSTGPHLDFRVHKNGQAINPLNMETPPGEPVLPELRDSFLIVKEKTLAELDSFRIRHQHLRNVPEI